MTAYYVRYVAGPYNGVRRVEAEDAEAALAIVRGCIRRAMTLGMYSDSYKILNERDMERRPAED